MRNCRGRHGQNGILLTRVTGTRVYDNDFSFMSGWGLGMYRSSENVVTRNVFDYCARGYSHGVYWSGQDSAGILMFERCSDNVIALNSATHCGSGLFLFAGRDIVEGLAFERGEKEPGGSDRNLIYQNDFSYAIANGIDATFSSGNYVVENVLRGCRQHGVWGGYSRGMVLIGNLIENTRGGGISIEHGQDTVIERNVLHGNEIGLELYWDEDPHLVRGEFGQRFDTSSRGHLIVGNSFSKNDSDLQIHKTTRILFAENVYDPDVRPIHASQLSDAMGRDMDKAELLERLSGVGAWMPSGHVSQTSLLPPDHERLPTMKASGILDFELPEFPGFQQAYAAGGAPGDGLESIVMGEWGPWDFRGGDPRPSPQLPGGVLADASWDVVWFRWSDGTDPRGSSENLRAWRELAKQPLVTGRVRSWISAWGGDQGVRERVGESHFGLIATTPREPARRPLPPVDHVGRRCAHPARRQHGPRQLDLARADEGRGRARAGAGRTRVHAGVLPDRRHECPEPRPRARRPLMKRPRGLTHRIDSTGARILPCRRVPARPRRGPGCQREVA